MKKIIAICILTALCLTMLVGCDMQGGLIAELFGQKGNDFYEQPPVPGDDVILVEPIETNPEYTEIWTDEIYTEEWTEDIEYTIPDIRIPEFAGAYYFDVTWEHGVHRESLYYYDPQTEWDHTLQLPDTALQDGGQLVITCCVGFNQSGDLSYGCNIPDSTARRGGLTSVHSGYVDLDFADWIDGVVLSIPVEKLCVGRNQVEFFAYALNGTVEGYVMWETIDVYIYETETDHDLADTEG